MKKILITFIMAIIAISFSACSSDNDNNNEPVVNPEVPTDGSKILVAYFSWGGNTRAVAMQIAQLTGGTLYEIQPTTLLAMARMEVIQAVWNRG